MAVLKVSNAAQLHVALSSAKGGDTIYLKSGNYSAVTLSNYKFSSDVTIKSESGKGAVFSKLIVDKSENIVFDSIEVSNPATGDNKFVHVNESSGISLINSEIHGSEDGNHTFNPAWTIGGSAVSISRSTDIVVSNNYIHDAEFGSHFSHVKGLVLSGNKFDHLGADSMQLNAITDGLIENNIGAANIIASTQEHVDFIQFMGYATNVVVRGNMLLPKSLTFVEYPLAPGVPDGGFNTYYQGMLFKGAAFKDVTIENNLIYTNTVNGILVHGGEGASGIIIRDNTVLTFPELNAPGRDLTPTGSLWGRAEIRAINVPVGSVIIENNVTNKVWIDTDADVDSNPSYPFSSNESYVGSNLVILPAQYANYYVNALKGLGAKLSDFAIVDGSLAVNKGAYKLLLRTMGLDTNDRMAGDSSNNIMYGGNGKDYLDGKAGNDELYGGHGNDIIIAGDGDDYVAGDAGDDKLFGGNGNDTLQDSDGNDYFSAGNGDDVVEAGAGNDKVLGGAGNDTLDGMDGNDLLYGENGNDLIHGGAGNDFLDGGNGDDSLYGDDGNDLIYAGNGNDVVEAGAGNDKVLGSEGNDTINGMEGNDILYGGNGNDLIHGGDDNDWIDGGNGDDSLYGDDGDDVIYAGMGNNLVYGGAGNDRLYSKTGNDVIYANEGDDILSTGNGDDRLYGQDGNDILFAGAGNDILFGGSDNDKLYGETGNDVLNGYTGNDYLSGGTGNDTLLGEGGHDEIYGGVGNDIINGGTGNDQLYGGLGADTFVFDKAGAANVDVVHDFSSRSGDKLDISALLANNFGASSELSDFVTFTNNDGVITMSVDSDGGANNFVSVATFETLKWSPGVEQALQDAVITGY